MILTTRFHSLISFSEYIRETLGAILRQIAGLDHYVRALWKRVFGKIAGMRGNLVRKFPLGNEFIGHPAYGLQIKDNGFQVRVGLQCGYAVSS